MAARRVSSFKIDTSEPRDETTSPRAPLDGSRDDSSRKSNPGDNIYNLIALLDYDESEEQTPESGLLYSLKAVLGECFPDYTPCTIIAMHAFLLFVCLAIGPLILPVTENTVPTHISKVFFKGEDLDQDLHRWRYLYKSVMFISVLLSANVLLLIAIMIARFLIMKVVFEPLYKISRLIIAVTYALDPYVYYCAWTTLNYWIFDHTIVLVGENLYGCNIYGDYVMSTYTTDERCFEWTKWVYILHILLSGRKLILSSILFLFELGFLRNYCTDLKTFLRSQAMLRKFNIAWLVYLKNVLKSCEDPKKINRLKETIYKHTLADIPDVLKRKYKAQTVTRLSSDFKVFRPTVYKLSHEQLNPSLDARIKMFPKHLRLRTIKSCSHSALANWSALNFLIHNPPELLMLDFSVELGSKETVETASKLLFDQMFDTLSAVRFAAPSQPTVDVPFEPPDLPSQEPEEHEVQIFNLDSKFTFVRQHTFGTEEQQPKQQQQQQQQSTSDVKPDTAAPAKTTSEAPRALQPSASMTSVPDPELERLVSLFGGRKKQHHGFMEYRAFALDPEIEVELRPEQMLAPMATYYLHDDHIDDHHRVITPKMCLGISQSLIDQLFSQYDVGACGYISADCFRRNILHLCSIRKRLIATLKNQRSILGLVKRLASVILWFTLVVVFLLSFKVNKNVVFPSTIGFFSATIMALSHMYTSFITAIIFVVLSNPYNVGDKVRVDGGETLYVQSITTYNTEFRCIHGKVITYQNAVLSKLTITNETRSQHATHEFTLVIASNTTPASLKQFKENMKGYVNGRPRHFVKNGCYFFGETLQIGHHYTLKLWVTCIENWTNSKVVYGLKNDIAKAIARQCQLLGITYKQPITPLRFKNSLGIQDKGCAFGSSQPQVDLPAAAPPIPSTRAKDARHF